MSNYTKTTNFATKDNLSPGNPLKIVKGTEIDTEFNNIQTAVATKTDNSAANITGGSITGITDLAVADGGTGASTATAALNNLLPSQTSNANKYLQTDGTNATWDAVSLSTSDITGTLPVANGGTGVTSSTGTGNVVLSNSPTLVTPALGTPSALVGTNITGTASGLTAGTVTTNANLTGGVTSVGNAATVVTNANLTGAVTSVGNATSLGSFSSANLLAALTDETGTGSAVFATSPTLVTPALGTPSALVGTNITGTASGLTAGNVTTNANLTGAVTSVGNATSLGSFSSANLLGALTDETGTGSAVFATSPTLVTPILGTPTSATLTNATGLPIATGVSGLGTGIATALAVNTGSSGAPVINGGVLGTPSSGTVTNLTGTASININGTVGATTASTGAFTTLSATGNVTLGDASTDTLNVGNGGLIKDASGNLGLGVTPSAWTVFKVMQLGNFGAIGGVDSASMNMFANTFYDGAFKYTNTHTGATRYRMDEEHSWFTAPSGTAGNAITFSEGMRLTSTGLGIGTSSPSAKLHISGDLNSAYGIKLQSTRGTGRTYGFATVGTNADSLSIYDVTGSETSLMNLSNTGAVALKGGVTTATGTGITFPATQSASSDANTLDDYEEGTWTPVVSDATSGGNLATLTEGEGVYTKIGNVVYWRFNVTLTSKGSMTAGNEVVIQGFPFQAAAVSGSWYNPCPAIIRNITFTGYVQFTTVGTTTYGYFRENVSNAGGDNIIVSDITNSATMQVSGFYRVA